MKLKTFFLATLALLSTFSAQALEVGVVNFKVCVELSKIGKQEQANFESLKKQMESILHEKEKTLTGMAEKLEDPDYLDSITPEAETDLKRNFRAMSQEFAQQQNQYYQTLSQANMQIVQKIAADVTEASQEVAKTKKLDLILNEEGCFYYSDKLDISKDVVVVMDENFEKEQKEAKTNPSVNQAVK